MPAWQSALKVVPDPYKKPAAVGAGAASALSAAPAPTGAMDTGIVGSPGLPKASNIPAPGVSAPAAASTSYKPPAVIGAGAGAAATVPKPPTAPAGSSFTSPEYTDWLAKQNEAYANLEKLMTTPFSYDPNNDPAYQAQVNLAQQRAGVATHNAMEAANEKGILGSSTNISQLGQIQQQAEQEAQSYIPQYREQAYGQYQNSIANAAQMLSAASSGRQQQFGEATMEAGLTGTYQSPEVRGLTDQLMKLKQQAEAPGITAAARTALSKQADGIRSKLSGMGVDISNLGANVNSSSINQGNVGVKTQSAIQDEWNRAHTENRDKVADTQWEKTFDLGSKETMANLTGHLPDGTATTAEQQRLLGNLWTAAGQTGTIPDQLADMYGIPRGTKTQAAYQFAKGLSVDWYNAQTSRQNANTNSDQLNLDYIKTDMAANQPNGSTKTTSPDAAGNILKQSLSKVLGTDKMTGEVKYGTLSDPVKREQAFIDAWNTSGVAPGSDTVEMLSKAGYSAAEIATLKKKYPEAFQPAAQ